MRTIAISKKYGTQTILKDTSIEIPTGAIYGLLGENGAGKTTLMKILLGLLKADSGRITIFGQEITSYSQIPYQNIGCMIESPSFYPNLTAQENLELFSKYRGVPSRNAIQNMLEKLGLPYGDGKTVAQYSLGMKQKLSLANALVHQPKILVLDEPINGLDPSAVVVVRNMLLEVNQANKTTILLSSHILSEISEIADIVGVLHGGKIVREESMKTIGAVSTHAYDLIVSTTELAAYILDEFFSTCQYEVVGASKIRVSGEQLNIGEINGTLVQRGVAVNAIIPYQETLEKYYMKIISS